MDNVPFFFDEDFLSSMIESYKRNHQIILSENFVRCAEKKLRSDFEIKSKLKVSKRVQMSTSPNGRGVFDIASGVTKIPYGIWIANN